MTKVCPINSRLVNERVARSNAFFTFAITTAWIFSGSWFLIAFLLIDFFVRGFADGKYSLLFVLGKFVVSRFHLREKNIDAGPKVFAARIGFLMLALILFFSLTGIHAASLVVAFVLAFFAGLESFFGICVACAIYPYFNALIGAWKPEIKSSK